MGMVEQRRVHDEDGVMYAVDRAWCCRLLQAAGVCGADGVDEIPDTWSELRTWLEAVSALARRGGDGVRAGAAPR